MQCPHSGRVLVAMKREFNREVQRETYPISRGDHMRQHIAFLHTSPVHVETFERLVRAANPAIKIEHVVAEDLLAEAQSVGPADPALVARVQDAMKSAASNGAAIVACTCSTIGGAAEKTPTDGRFIAARIDRAMADRAVKLGPHILVVAALESTLKPTVDLIQESASAVGINTEIQLVLASDAWPHFTNGDREAYIEAVVQAVRTAPRTANVIVLAQASMASAAESLRELGVEVLSSPRIGVQSLLACLGQ